jgi:hypothetical protein
MTRKIKIETVADLDRARDQDLAREFSFLVDAQDVAPIKEYFGKKALEYDSFFVRQQGGDYLEVYGMNGTVPYKSKFLEKVL